MYNIKIYKNDAYELICKAEIETDIENNFMDTYGYKLKVGRRGWNELGDCSWHIYTAMCKIGNEWEPTV